MRKKTVVSLSTIPPRFDKLAPTLLALLKQSLPADEIHLYIPKTYKRFPEHVFSVPSVPEGISVKVVDEDFGPATKVLPCAQAHWGTDTRIIYCDDDRLPPSNWLAAFASASDRRPDDVIVASGDSGDKYGFDGAITEKRPLVIGKSRRDLRYYAARFRQKILEIATLSKRPKPARYPFRQSGYLDFAHGLGGVSIKPEFLAKEDFEIPKVVWAVDDIWLSGAYERKGIGIWADKSIPLAPSAEVASFSSLASSTIEGHSRADADLACIHLMQKTYGIWNPDIPV